MHVVATADTSIEPKSDLDLCFASAVCRDREGKDRCARVFRLAAEAEDRNLRLLGYEAREQGR